MGMRLRSCEESAEQIKSRELSGELAELVVYTKSLRGVCF